MATVRGRRVGQRISPRTPFVEEIVPNSVWSDDSMAHYLLVDLPGFKKEEVKLQVDSSGDIIARGEKQENEEKHVRFLLTFPAPINSDMDKIAGKFDGEILYVTVPKRNVQENKESGAEKANGHVGGAEENKEEEQNTDSDGRDYSQHGSHTEQEETRNQNADNEGSDHTQHGYHREMEETRNENTHNGGRDHTQHGYHREKEETRNENADNGGRDHTQHCYHREKEERRNGNAYMGGFSEELVRKWEQEPNILRSAVQVLRKNKGIVVTAVLAFSLGLLVSRKFQSSTAP